MKTDKILKQHNNHPDLISLIDKIQEFHNNNGHYPSAKEFDTTDYLPSSRQIQRRWGGLVYLKEQLGIKDSDARKGKIRSEVAKLAEARNTKIEADFMGDIKPFTDRRNVHHPFCPYDDSKSNIDFVIYHPTEAKAIGLEFFFPSNKESFHGCLNIKGHKKQYLDVIDGLETSFYYVVTNPDITKADINEWLSAKKTEPNCDGVIHISEVLPLLKAEKYCII